jgi:hypothetical protein
MFSEWAREAIKNRLRKRKLIFHRIIRNNLSCISENIHTSLDHLHAQLRLKIQILDDDAKRSIEQPPSLRLRLAEVRNKGLMSVLLRMSEPLDEKSLHDTVSCHRKTR